MTGRGAPALAGAAALVQLALRALAAWVVTCVVGWGLVELARDPPAVAAARAAAALPPDDVRDPGARARVVARYARELDLGGGAPARLARAAARALAIDPGVSWRDRRPVGAIVRGGAWATAGRALAAVALALVAGVALALGAGRRGRGALALGAGVLLAVPTVWLCQLALTAAPGLATSATLAIVVLAAAPAAAVALHVGAALRTLDGSPLAIAAAARGVGPGRWRAVHALRLVGPGLAPLVPSIAGFVLGASPVVERALAVPGAGQLLVAAAASGDAPVVIALAAGAAAAVALLGGLARVAARRLDPRLA